MARPLQGMEVNAIGTRNIIQVASQLVKMLQRLVSASSSGVRTARNLPGRNGDYRRPHLPPTLNTDFGRFVMKEWG